MRIALFALVASCTAPPPVGIGESVSAVDITCNAGCGGGLATRPLPGPSGTVQFTAYSNSPNLGDGYNDCDSGPSDCKAGAHTAANGVAAYGCTWQCVELINRYNATVWGAPEIYANAGPTFCSTAASSSLPQYYVYGQSGVATSGHAPVAGDTLVWNGHVAIALNAVTPGAAGTIGVLTQNATCSGTDTVSWDGSMFGGKYGLGALCWIHETSNSGVVAGDPCSAASLGNGDYCGGSLPGTHADGDTLYSCAGGATASKKMCPCGCHIMPAGQNDVCETNCPSPDLGSTSMPDGAVAPSDGGSAGDVPAASDDGAVQDVPRSGPGNANPGGGHGCSAASAGDARSALPILLALAALAILRRRRSHAANERR